MLWIWSISKNQLEIHSTIGLIKLPHTIFCSTHVLVITDIKSSQDCDIWVLIIAG